jgi:hypothetical protein
LSLEIGGDKRRRASIAKIANIEHPESSFANSSPARQGVRTPAMTSAD